LKREDRSGYSLIMSAFQGKYRFFQEALEREFRKKGFAAFSLCLDPETLPAEIVDGLDAVSASRIAAILEEVGAAITVVPTRDVVGVRSNVEECWPNRSAGYWHFSEVEGLILTLEPLNARKNVRQIKERSPETDPEFPKADWGDCAECGTEVLVRNLQLRTKV
jgi:hypothetical protein